jgi:hypothetical protein
VGENIIPAFVYLETAIEEETENLELLYSMATAIRFQLQAFSLPKIEIGYVDTQSFKHPKSDK